MKFILSIVFLLVFFAGYTQNYTFVDLPYIETSAKADTTVVPDRIYLSVTLSEADSKGKISVEELESRLISRLGELNIDPEEQLSVSDYSSEYRKYFLRKKEILKKKTYSLVVNDLSTYSNVITGLEEAGISNVSFERVEYTGAAKVKHQLKTRAVLAAKENAVNLAAQLGQKIRSAIHISDLEDEIPAGEAGGNKLISNEERPSGDFKKMKIGVSVKVTFELE